MPRFLGQARKVKTECENNVNFSKNCVTAVRGNSLTFAM